MLTQYGYMPVQWMSLNCAPNCEQIRSPFTEHHHLIQGDSGRAYFIASRKRLINQNTRASKIMIGQNMIAQPFRSLVLNGFPTFPQNHLKHHASTLLNERFAIATEFMVIQNQFAILPTCKIRQCSHHVLRFDHG